MVAVGTPAWVDTEATVSRLPWFGSGRNHYVFGRGLFQAYQYDGYGQLTILPYFYSDINGTSLDPFCTSNSTESSFPLLREMAEELPGFYRGRRYNSHDWCQKRITAAVFGVFTCMFACIAVIATSCAQKGLCNQTPFIICTLFVFLMGLITASIIGGFIDLERNGISRQDVDERFFPFPQETVPGYSLVLFIVAILMYLLSLFLAVCEKWCHEGKVEGGTPKLKLSSSA